jgi:hypothetical protein
MAKTTTRSRTATIRFSPENLAAAAKVAALTGRTVSSLAEYALVLFMRQNYPMAYNPDAVLVLKLDEAPKLTTLHRVAMGEHVPRQQLPESFGTTPYPPPKYSLGK